jgi:imidazolonepropionase
MLAEGVTTVECKSGYGLSPRHELKQLHAIRELARRQPIDLVPTYLGAHAIPAEYEGRADAFIDEMASDKLLGEIRRKKLAAFCDVFCDRGAFTVDQARRVLTRAAAYGLRPKLHADELAQIGASRLAGEVGAVSADHLELIDDAGIAAMREAGAIAVVLPGTSFFLGIEHAPARRMIEAGLPVALATDLNPGSSHIESLSLIMHIACCQLRMRPEEVLTAVTANAAAACGVEKSRGAIAEGFEADLVVMNVPDLAAWFYTPGRLHVRTVLKRGGVAWQRVN